MNNYEDFDLDLKTVTFAGANEKSLTVTEVSIVVCSTPFTQKCQMPTKNRPSASCHKSVNDMIQVRC